ncbi:MAG: S8 family serine peptidase [Solirubrobacteraceae bacterium]
MSSRPSRLQSVLGAALLLGLVLLLAPTARAASERTGRLLVTLEPQAEVGGVADLLGPGVRRDGAQVPQIDLVSVRPTGGRALAAVAGLLRGRSDVRHVEYERRHELRVVPDDPSLTTLETAPGTPPGTPLQWWVGRMGLPAAWDLQRGGDATVAVIDTGADGGQPDLAGKIAQSIDNDSTPGAGPATGDENGHGTHVSSLACAAGDNATGIVGAGLDCRLIVIKTDLGDGSIARSIVQAADLGADAINMSFGTNGAAPATRAITEAIDYAVDKDVVLVAAAADRPVEQQGDPANLLQPTGSGSDITAGRGLSVTAADFFDRRAPFAGRGSQISLAAYGSFDQTLGPPGLISGFPGNPTKLESGGGGLLPQPPCNCRAQIGGDNRYAYLQGTSMAAPIVAATAALTRTLNPDLSAAEVIRVLKQTASRPAGSGWTPELGWGIVNAGAALNAAAAIDRTAPASKLRGPKRVRRPRTVKLTWSGSDPAPVKLTASGIAHYEVYRSTDRKAYKRIKRTSKTSLRVLTRAGSRYRFYTIAVDKAGNREAVPRRRDLSTLVDRAR